MLYNYTRKQKISVGKFEGDFDYYIEKLGWNTDDNIMAYGDYGNTIYYNSQPPEDITNLNAENVWSLCVFAAKKLGVKPEDLWADFLNDDVFDPNEIKTVTL